MGEDMGREVVRLNQSHFMRAWPPWLNPTINTMADLQPCNTTIGWCLERMGPPASYRCASVPPVTKLPLHLRRKTTALDAAPDTLSSSGSSSASSPSASSSGLSSSSLCLRLVTVGGGEESERK